MWRFVVARGAAKPYLYMTGKTTFNADLFGAEHLMVEDEAESIDIRARRYFGAKIKEIAVNVDQHCHGKGKTALTLTPVWRMTLSLNDEPERMQVLPPASPEMVVPFEAMSSALNQKSCGISAL